MAVNLLLMGRNGNGKSSTANSILGRRAFISTNNSQSSIDNIRSESSMVDGKMVTVVDGPYIKDTDLNDPEDIKLALECGDKVMAICREGFHAVIIILKYGVRYTKQEKDAVFLIRAMFGDNVIKDHGICVFICGDLFDSDMEDDKSSFESWCMKQTGDMANLFKECNNRCVIFNNRATDDWSKRCQLDMLLSFVDKFHGRRYTNTEYSHAKMGRVGLVVTSKCPRLEKETRRVLQEISVALTQIDVLRKPEDSRRTLRSLKEKIENHKSYLKQEADGTQLLENIFGEISVIENSLDIKLAITDKVLQGLQDQGPQTARPDEADYLIGSTTHPRGHAWWESITNTVRWLFNWFRNKVVRLL